MRTYTLTHTHIQEQQTVDNIINARDPSMVNFKCAVLSLLEGEIYIQNDPTDEPPE